MSGSQTKLRVRIEFEKYISSTDPKSKLQQKLILNDFGFYQRAFTLKFSEANLEDRVVENDTLVLMYGLDGVRRTSVESITNKEVVAKVVSLVESIFPSIYQKAKA